MILGTAGHIDHGKTALVRALTGVDTDRLPEEKRRGITIELGFAPLTLADGRTLGVVDVPGHEAFVRTMVAGATGVDLALLVVAADEGVMPQTTEHLAILNLLGVRGGVVALTKCDLVDEEWLRLVTDDLRVTLAGGVLERADIVRVSARTGAGVEELRLAIGRAADLARYDQPSGAEDLFRMPIDRVFSLKGTGTIVTGTVWSGRLDRGSAWVYPPGRSVRVRDLQTHGTPVDFVGPGTRAAVALGDAGVRDIQRGAVLLGTAEWEPTDTIRCTLQLLPDSAFRPTSRFRVRLHLGSAEVGARMVRIGSDVVRVHLETPLVCRMGDRFIVRGGPRLTTLGGGTVIDPYSRRRARLPRNRTFTPPRLLVTYAEEAGSSGVTRRSLPVRLGVRPAEVAAMLAGGSLCVTSERVYDPAVAIEVRRRLLESVDSVHRTKPLAPGVVLQEARAAAGVPADLFDYVLSRSVRDGELATSGGFLHRPGWRARLNDAQSQLADAMMNAFCRAAEPTSETRVVEQYGTASLPVLRYLEREGAVVRLGEAVVAETVVKALVARLRGHMEPGRTYSPAELRDALGVSRKVLIPLLEYCDRARVTERRGSERVLRV